MDDKILYAEITLKVRTCNLITEDRLEAEYGGDMEAFVRDEIEVNGLDSITNLEIEPEITRVDKKEYDDSELLNLNF